MVEVINFKVRSKGKVYTKGEFIKDLSKKEEERLVKLGFAKITEQQVRNPGIEDMNVDDAKQLVDSMDSVDKLNELLEIEEQGKNRVSLIKFIQEKIEDLKSEDE